MGTVVVALNRGLFDRSVHSFDLIILPSGLNFFKPVLDFVFVANPIEYVNSGIQMALLPYAYGVDRLVMTATGEAI